MTSDELRECPFCGGKAELNVQKSTGHCRVLCETDGCMNYAFRVSYLTKEAAINAWNKRVGGGK